MKSVLCVKLKTKTKKEKKNVMKSLSAEEEEVTGQKFNPTR